MKYLTELEQLKIKFEELQKKGNGSGGQGGKLTEKSIEGMQSENEILIMENEDLRVIYNT